MKSLLVMFLCVIRLSSFSQGDNCNTSIQFCSDIGYTYASTIDALMDTSSVNYGCLASQRNVKWFHFQITQPGSMEITISNIQNVDIDFIAWGPYVNLNTACNPSNTGVDCSYSTATTEIFNLASTNVGEYYLLAISNFANVSADISLAQTAGNASAMCAGLNNCYGYFNFSNSSQCDSLTNSYVYQGEYVGINRPSTGNLIITNCSGDSVVFTAPFADTSNFSFSGNSSGDVCQLQAYYTDSLLCTSYGNYQIPNSCICNTTNYFSISSVSQNVCLDTCSGVATVISNGGTSPFSYNWSGYPNDSIQFIDSLCVGNYFVSVTDSLGCVKSLTVEINSTLVIDTVIVSSCDLVTNLYTLTGNIITSSPPPGGQLVIYTSFGDSLIISAPFADTIPFTVSGNSLGQSGIIDAYFSEDSTCITSHFFDEPLVCNCVVASNYSLTTVNGSSCIDSCFGSVEAIVTGGFLPLQYVWSFPLVQTSSQITNLCLGSYVVTVTDSIGCVISGTALVDSITENNSYDISSNQVILLGDSVQICVLDTANSIDSYLWETGEQTACIYVNPTQSIYYNVSITFCGAVVEDSVFVMVDSANGTNFLDTEIQFLIFPNPVLNELNLQMDVEKRLDIEIEIISTTGKVVMNEVLVVNKGKTVHKINLEAQKMAGGLYYLTIKSDGYQTTTPFVVK